MFVSYNLPYSEHGYQLPVESFTTMSLSGPFCLSASGIFAQTSFDGLAMDEKTNLLIGQTNNIQLGVTNDSIGHRLIHNLKNQTLQIYISNITGSQYPSFPPFAMTLVVHPILPWI